MESSLPMPLKHTTETVLIVLLAAMIILTGIVIAFLPPLTVSTLPWGIAFAVSLIYPLAFYPLLKSRRADYPFRTLHFFPALMLVVWLVFELLLPVPGMARVASVEHFYTWGGSLFAVVLAFLLLVLFSLNVIRQRFSRLILLFLLLVPFVALAVTVERRDWRTQMASTLWEKLHLTAQSGSLLAQGGSSKGASSQRSSLRSTPSKPFFPHASQGSRSSVPPHLSSSGPGLESIGILFVAGYCGALHQRARKRMRA